MPKTSTPTPAPAPVVDDASESLGEWFQSHGRQTGIAVIAIAAVALVTWVWRTASDRKEQSASRSLAEAQLAFSSGNIPLAQSDLQKVVAQFGGTASGTQARILLAQTYFDQAKPAEGLKALDEGGPGAFPAGYHAVRAAGLEQLNKPAEAADEYLKAAQSANDDADRDSFKADAARAYTNAKQVDQARKLWTELAQDETSALAGEAKVHLGELDAKAAPKG